MIYTDGLTTLFLFGGVYAAGTFKMSPHDVLLFAIALNVTAGLGAFAFAWFDDYIGSKKVIVISLISLSIVTTVMLSVESLQLFWAFGLLLGVFVGPLQASSRALMAKVTPKEKQNQMFGLFAFSGKATGSWTALCGSHDLFDRKPTFGHQHFDSILYLRPALNFKSTLRRKV